MYVFIYIYIYVYIYIYIYTQHSFLSGCQIRSVSMQWRPSFLSVLRDGATHFQSCSAVAHLISSVFRSWRTYAQNSQKKS